MIRANSCVQQGCRYKDQGFEPCTGGCVEAGHGYEYPQYGGYPLAAAAGIVGARPVHRVSSSDSAAGNSSHEAPGCPCGDDVQPCAFCAANDEHCGDPG